MKILKRTAVALLALLPLLTGMAFADTEQWFGRIKSDHLIKSSPSGCGREAKLA